ncbi:hypothetical protein [Microbacterium sp. MYb62]|uniref:hypothetical protein n=1 Tax=Microbacterium sp. MYb62 TaxID=1848690 RepID=UPI000CFE03B2|nr:hypothetical protein [Microbacterium sp. MYb62]PRB10091.1 hypothetical protein CQ042_18445 [Microbacterium sp. MYb62]
MNTSESPNPENTPRPFGYWLKAADRLMAAEFATAFDSEHASRRDWRLLNVIDGTVPADRPMNGHKLHRLVERGWVAPEGDGWTLTDDGRAAKERLGAIVDEIRAKVSGAVSDEEMATTLASLEKIARAFGWDEETPLPRGRRHGFGGHGRGRGFPRGFGHPFGRGFGHGHGARFEHDEDHGFAHGRGHGFGPDGHSGHRGQGHDRGREHGHGPHRAERIAQHAFERGFDAGFARGRDA